MEAHEYQGEYLAIPCEANPSYVVVSRSTTRSSAATAGTIQEKSGVSCDWYKTIVLIVLVLVGVVACAGLAVAVWSSTKVDSIDSRYVLILMYELASFIFGMQFQGHMPYFLLSTLTVHAV